MEQLKRCNKYLLGIPKGEEREKGIEEIFEAKPGGSGHTKQNKYPKHHT